MTLNIKKTGISFNRPVVSIFLILVSLSILYYFIKNNFYPSDENKNITLNSFEQQLAQKMMIDIRYFCDTKNHDETPCTTSVTELPKPLYSLIHEVNIGGVVLFGNNIVSATQVLKLTSQLQNAALSSQSSTPLLIAVDQEGGRVVRLPRNSATSFAGNMAIGATYERHGVHYATEIGKIIASELLTVGINLNFSPIVDVNVNPMNPVINVRSFGKDPNRVAELGIAMMNGIQSNHVIATLKHFPGHGNTDIDSHTGLPTLNYSYSDIENIDLIPFKKAIKQGNPGMIMTAHIQYPQLDSSTLNSINGEPLIRPATMSKKILSGILREKLHYQGVIITDALDMDSISKNFPIELSVSESFKAGSDIALMPMAISSESDIIKFKLFIRRIAEILSDSQYSIKEISQSNERIRALKNSYLISPRLMASKNKKTHIRQPLLASEKSRLIERQLAEDSITIIQNKKHVIPLNSEHDYKIHVIVETSQQQKILQTSLQTNWKEKNTAPLTIIFSKLNDYRQSIRKNDSYQEDALVIVYSGGGNSAAETVSLQQWKNSNSSKTEISTSVNLLASVDLSRTIKPSKTKVIAEQLLKAKNNQIKTILIGMRSPYNLSQFLPIADSVVVAYDSTTYLDTKTGSVTGVTYSAAASLILGVNQPQGVLPVSLLEPSQQNLSLFSTAK